MYVCTPCACRSPQRSEEASDLLQLELCTAVSCHVGGGSPTWVLFEKIKYHLPSTSSSFLCINQKHCLHIRINEEFIAKTSFQTWGT